MLKYFFKQTLLQNMKISKTENKMSWHPGWEMNRREEATAKRKMKHKCHFGWHSPVVYMCRYPVEPFIQRQPEGEAGQGDTSWADGEDPHPPVRRWRCWGHPADPLWGRNLLQHHRMPQVHLTYLSVLSVVAACSFVKMYFSLSLLFLSRLHLHFGNLYRQDSPTYCMCQLTATGAFTTPISFHCCL